MAPLKVPLPPLLPTVRVAGGPPARLLVTVPEPFRPSMAVLLPFRSSVPPAFTVTLELGEVASAQSRPIWSGGTPLPIVVAPV